MRDDPVVIGLVTRAQNGDQQAWNALIERYAPLVWSICRRYQLGNADAQDVSQNVWMRLVHHLGSLRDPAAIPGWLATTTQRECGRAVRASCSPRVVTLEPGIENIPEAEVGMAEQELLIAERHAALREALSDLSPCCQQLIALLTQDPPASYAQISARLGIPVGSIGPSRRRCLDRLRRHPAMAALIDDAGHEES